MVAHPVDTIMLEQRAASFTRRSIKESAKKQGLRLALSMVDLTTLEGSDSPEKVRSLCRKAIRPWEGEIDPPLPSVAAVCVYPNLVPAAKEVLDGTGIKIASVATGFPSGQYPLSVRLRDAAEAVAAGADEIDMVINRGAFLAGRDDEVAEEIREVRSAVHPAHLKIILETGELGNYDAIRRASDLAIEAAASTGPIQDGEVFIKTSTGKIAPAATMPAVLVMLEAIRDHWFATGIRIGMKPAGGIRRAKAALHQLAMVKETLGDDWLTPKLFRFGASSLTNDLLRQIIRLERKRYMAGHDFSEA
ncbi:MAG: deoxyribose-phosphate aldolase [Phycisphaerae bacterium]|nr:deoxyribose-phosphate aldolase [Phycisphaerae bacterium]|tara:strand:+ start:66 stop:980 length:915 start_codon:yes stop_codon:yes gene_type:complete